MTIRNGYANFVEVRDKNVMKKCCVVGGDK